MTSFNGSVEYWAWFSWVTYKRRTMSNYRLWNVTGGLLLLVVGRPGRVVDLSMYLGRVALSSLLIIALVILFQQFEIDVFSLFCWVIPRPSVDVVVLLLVTTCPINWPKHLRKQTLVSEWLFHHSKAVVRYVWSGARKNVPKTPTTSVTVWWP
jgi:hypothetical protein